MKNIEVGLLPSGDQWYVYHTGVGQWNIFDSEEDAMFCAKIMKEDFGGVICRMPDAEVT